jgi:hypothetical protein
MPDRNDDLLAIRNQSAQQAALRQIANQAQCEADEYHRYIKEGDTEKAAWAQRTYSALALEYNTLLANMAGQQQQAQPQAQQPQQQSQEAQPPQFTAVEQELLKSYPQIASDPQKWHTALAASRNLQLRGYSRDSTEYIQAIAHACGVLNADMTESNEVASPDEALRACQSKYGAVTVEEYNRGVERLEQEKLAGKYPMSQT